MLTEVLQAISRASYISKANIALEIKKSEALVEDAFYQLARMGYIKEDKHQTVSCTAACKGCAFASSCNKLPVNSIAITDKGRQLLEENTKNK